jgi:hypothetical protein
VPDSPTSPPSRDARWPEALVWAGVAACLAGFLQYRLWQALPAGRFGESLLLAALVALVAWPLRRWRGWRWADALALVWVAALVALTGALPALAVALLLAAAAALGSVVTGASRPLLACLCGLALIAAAVGWTLPLPVHYWWTYLPLLLLAVGWRQRALREQALVCAAGWRAAVQACPRGAAWGVLVLGLASTGAWLPTMQYDDLAYHLGLPWQLLRHGRYALDPTHQVWALAPWASDVLQAVPQVLARTEARSALNLAWLVAGAAGLWQLSRLLGLRPAMGWLVLALFGSLPLAAGLLTGMQTETAAAAVTVALALLVLDEGRDGARRLLAGALLLGLLFALKPLHGVVALPLLAWAAWRQRRARPGVAPLLAALLGTVLVAGSSYAYAWIVTGNPVLPLLNDLFSSTWFAPVRFNDARWQQGLDPGVLWELSFDTAHYLEGWAGGAGFLLVALAGAWVLALLDRRSRGLALCATLAIVLPLLPLQYARYLHPGMVLLLPALVLAVQRWLPARRGMVLLALLCVLDLAFQANAQWLLHVGGSKRSVLALGRDMPLFTRYAPERVLAAAIRERAPGGGAVLVLPHPFHAELAGRGRTVEWYAPKWHAATRAAEADPSGGAWAGLLRRERIADVIVRPEHLTPAQRAGLQRLGAVRTRQVGEAAWWRIPAGDDAP